MMRASWGEGERERERERETHRKTYVIMWSARVVVKDLSIDVARTSAAVYERVIESLAVESALS